MAGGRHTKKTMTSNTNVTSKASTGQPGSPIPAVGRSPEEVIHAFRSSALERNFEMPTIPSVLLPLGGSQDITLSPQGLLEWVELRCEATVTITLGSGGQVRMSARGPYNLLTHVFLIDPDNWPCIVNVDGYELQLDELTLFRRFPHDPAFAYGPQYDYSAGVVQYPIAGGANQWEWNVPVRAAINPDLGDFRGIMDLASANARAHVQFIVNSSLIGATDDSVLVILNGAPTATLTSFTVTPVLHFRQPVTIVDPDSGQTWRPWPQTELETVHEITSLRSSSLNPGSYNPITFATGRDYLKVIEQLVIGGIQVVGTVGGQGAAGATRVRFLVNDSTPIWDYDLRDYTKGIRRLYGRDFNAFVWPLDYRVWESSMYGDLVTDLQLAVGLSTGGSYIQQMRKCTYQAGSVEPLGAN